MLTAGTLGLVGPHPVRPASGRTGDATLLALADPYLQGLNRVALAFTDADGVRYAGIGADESTLFAIGSVSKTFCGGLLMEMAERGEVSLDTAVGSLVEAGGSELADVTLRELASHTAGLPEFTPRQTRRSNLVFGLLHGDGLSQEPQETIADVLEQPLVGRGSYRYSTAGIALLGQVLAVRAGVPYAELLRTRLLEPWALTRTSTPLTRAGMPPGWSKGLLGGRPADPWLLNGLAPGGGMWSTAADLSQWVSLTRDGRQPGAAGLAPIAPAPIPPVFLDAQMSITWVVTTTPAGNDLVFHNGLTGSHHAYAGFSRTTGRGVAYLVNNVPTGAQLSGLQGELVVSLLDKGVPQ